MTKVSQKKENDKSRLEQKLPSVTNIHTTVEEITPEKARNWLKRNLPTNRNQTKNHIRYLAGQMQAGHWKLNGEAIKFDLGNHLIDGQHRLMAVIESGVSIQSLVVRGVPSHYFYTIDLGKVRTNGNALQSEGIGNANTVAACINHVLYIRNAYNTIGKTPPHKILEFIEHNPRILDCVSYISKMKTNSKFKHLSSSIGSALYFECSKTHLKQADEFFYKLYTGIGIEEDSPILRLRVKLVGTRHARARANQKAAYVIKAWRYYRLNKKMKQLGWNSDKEKFPKII